MGTVISLAEIGTDPERANAWTREAADNANRIVRNRMGIARTPMGKPPAGYVTLQLAACGCARPTCTMAPCPRCAPCSSLRS